MANQTTRRVKVYSKNHPATPGWQNTGYRAVPWLNVSGLWLQRAGFMIGDPVEITVTENQLIIKNKASHGDQRD